MFGLSYSEFVQGSALRTWNCVSHFATLLWYKFNHLRDPIMPRSRRRHHSRSKSRSRSHSHDRDREPKRRKIESYDSPQQKRSVSSQPEAIDSKTDDNGHNEQNNENIMDISSEHTSTEGSKGIAVQENDENSKEKSPQITSGKESGSSEEDIDKLVENKEESTKDAIEIEDQDDSEGVDSEDPEEKDEPEIKNNKDVSRTPRKLKDKNNDLTITPTRVVSPRQTQKRLESEKKRQEKQKEKEEKEQKRQDDLRKKLEEKKRMTEEKLRLKQEKDEQRIKEKQAKDEKKKKEQEEKDKKRREKEEKEEQKKREREQEKLKKQQEIDEKNKEKQKLEEQKQKTAAAFANFFLSKRNEVEERKSDELSTFMPFEVKSDMRLAPIIRSQIKNSNEFEDMFKNQTCDKLYLKNLKEGKEIGKSGKTWSFEDADQDEDVVIIEDNIGERIEEQKPKPEKMRAKLLKFHENQRPPYFGTFKKKSKTVGPRKPFGKDTIFNYEIDSEEEWEEEGEGESLKGTDDEDEKDNESENEYEVDNEVFVPHAYLSDDECDDEANSKLSPESHKAKLKLLKNEFDEEMKSKTKKIKPRVIGCIWYNKNNANVEEAIDRCLQPFSIICNGQIDIKKRSEFAASLKKVAKLLSKEHIPVFLKHIHGSVDKRINIVKAFIEYMSNNGVQLEMSKISLGKQLKSFAHWKKCPEEGVMHNKLCWYVGEDIRKEYNVDLSLPNKLSVKRAQAK